MVAKKKHLHDVNSLMSLPYLLKKIKTNLSAAGKMGCNCSSDYSDSEWIENLDEICEHCNCPIAPQSCNPVSISTTCAHLRQCTSKRMCARHLNMNELWLSLWLSTDDHFLEHGVNHASNSDVILSNSHIQYVRLKICNFSARTWITV